MNRIGTLILSGALLVSLAGCSGGEPSAGAPSPATSPAPTPSATQQATAATPKGNLGPNYEKIRADGTKSFGHYFLLGPNPTDAPDFSRDIMVQVDDVGAYTPSGNAAIDGKASKFEKYKITVINNSKYPQDMNLLSVSASDGDADAAQVTDYPSVGVAPNTPVRPGKTVHWFVAFGNDQHDQSVSIDATTKGDGGELASPNSALIWSK